MMGIRELVGHPDNYVRMVRVAFIAVFAALGVTCLVDLVWPIGAVVYIPALDFPRNHGHPKYNIQEGV